MRLLVALAAPLAVLGGGAAVARLHPHTVAGSLEAIRTADPVALCLAAACFAVSLVLSAASWRVLLAGCGASLTTAGACARYGVGSLVNAVLPCRAGDVVRIGLFSRAVPAGARTLTAAGAGAGVGAIRWLLLVPLATTGVATSGAPTLALPLGVAAGLLPLGVAALLGRRSRRLRALLDPLRQTGGRERIMLVACVAATLGARVLAATAVAVAFGTPAPLATALLVVTALELAAVAPLTPGNVGVAGGAAALAFHAHGLPLAVAAAAGLGLHAVETATGLAFGLASAVGLARRGIAWRNAPELAPAAA